MHVISVLIHSLKKIKGSVENTLNLDLKFIFIKKEIMYEVKLQHLEHNFILLILSGWSRW